MSSRHLLNEAAGDPSKLRSPQDPYQQLISSLTFLTQEYPPGSHRNHDCRGLYSGPTSIAYLFLLISRDLPDIAISGQKPLEWAKEYLSEPRDCQRATADKSGVINEHLAFLAVRGAVTKDTKHVEQLVALVRSVTLTSEGGSNEWLYGRAGCLYLLRLARSWVPDCAKIVNPAMQEVTEKVLSHGPSWPWHGKDYLGEQPRHLVHLFSSLFQKPLPETKIS